MVKQKRIQRLKPKMIYAPKQYLDYLNHHGVNASSAFRQMVVKLKSGEFTYERTNDRWTTLDVEKFATMKDDAKFTETEYPAEEEEEVVEEVAPITPSQSQSL